MRERERKERIMDNANMSDIENSMTFHHHFCESRLTQGPEVWNAYTSFLVSLVPCFFPKPHHLEFQQFAWMLMLNGPCSFYYHYHLTWLGKHLDETTMFLANYYLICGLSRFYKQKQRYFYILANSALLPFYLTFNVFPQNDVYFPFLYTSYCTFTCALLLDIAVKNKCRVSMARNLALTTFGASCWILSEAFCDETTVFGHVLWHLFFPLGIYRVVNMLDRMLII